MKRFKQLKYTKQNLYEIQSLCNDIKSRLCNENRIIIDIDAKFFGKFMVDYNNQLKE